MTCSYLPTGLRTEEREILSISESYDILTLIYTDPPKPQTLQKSTKVGAYGRQALHKVLTQIQLTVGLVETADPHYVYYYNYRIYGESEHTYT